MYPKALAHLIKDLRADYKENDRSAAFRQILINSQSNQVAMAQAIAGMGEDEVMVYEDDMCSIWTCRYANTLVLPPHEHGVSAHISVYQGAEIEIMYEPEQNRLRHIHTHTVKAGHVLSLDKQAIHAVTGRDPAPCLALHVYEGPLSNIQRDLFDWETGARVPFTTRTFHDMCRTHIHI